MNAPLTQIAAILHRSRIDLASDNANPVAFERRRNPRTEADKDAYIAELESDDYRRRFEIARDMHIEDERVQRGFWKAERERYELERMARNLAEAA